MKKYIIGIDEVGYGALAGPLVVCGFKAPIDWTFSGLKDSKKLSEKKRIKIATDLIRLTEIKEGNDINSYYGVADNDMIDKFGLGVVHKATFIDVMSRLYDNESEVICDGNLSFYNEILEEKGINPKDVKSVVKADDSVPSVMAASILGKTYRDLKMCRYNKDFPNYGFEKHKGYGTKAHKEAIKKYGFCNLHRKSYKIK